MPRSGDIVQASSVDRQISHRLERLPCSRCHGIAYYEGAKWSVVSELVNEHWKACPGNPRAWPTCMACMSTSLPDAAIALPPSAASERHSVPVAESVGSSNNTWISPGCERKRRTLEQRKLELEQDDYAQKVTTKSVVCGGCHKEISLDKRSNYYPGLWIKHRGKCPSIKQLQLAKAKVPHALSDPRQGPYDGANPACAFGHGDVLQHSFVKTYESRGTATTPQSVPYDSKNPSSKDEDGDLPPHKHERFPTLNGNFYRAERRRDGFVEWAYRYATEDEFDTNHFRGQDEPWGRCYNTYHSLQTGGQPRCVFENRPQQVVWPWSSNQGTPSQRTG